MKNHFVRLTAVSWAALVSVSLAQGPILISDGPETSSQMNPKHPNIITTDGPAKPSYSYPLPIVISDGPSEPPYVTVSGIVTSDGPGSQSVAVKTAEVKAAVPDPETSTLAPATVLTPPVKTMSQTPVERPLMMDQWKSPKNDGFFYVYSDQRASGNHFIPSGWMGDYSDIRFDDSSTENPHSGDTCIKITYSAKASQGSGWAGLYWQAPANNWGNSTAGGYNLRGKKRLTFWARGAKGGEVISEFKVGGIGGSRGDSDSASTGSIVLRKQWKKFTIGLADKDLSHIIGGFCWTANRESNPDGITFYLDDIRYE
jgi:hypothetical protein